MCTHPAIVAVQSEASGWKALCGHCALLACYEGPWDGSTVEEYVRRTGKSGFVYEMGESGSGGGFPESVFYQVVSVDRRSYPGWTYCHIFSGPIGALCKTSWQPAGSPVAIGYFRTALNIMTLDEFEIAQVMRS